MTNHHRQNALALERIMAQIKAEEDKDKLREMALQLAQVQYKRHRAELVRK
jgi:hypothetical protein